MVTTRAPPAGSVTRSDRVVPGSLGPSASVTPAVPSAAMIALTSRRVDGLVPIARISVPRSIPAASAVAPSNASLTKMRRAPSLASRTPKPALEPEA